MPINFFRKFRKLKIKKIARWKKNSKSNFPKRKLVRVLLFILLKFKLNLPLSFIDTANKKKSQYAKFLFGYRLLNYKRTWRHFFFFNFPKTFLMFRAYALFFKRRDFFGLMYEWENKEIFFKHPFSFSNLNMKIYGPIMRYNARILAMFKTFKWAEYKNDGGGFNKHGKFVLKFRDYKIRYGNKSYLNVNKFRKSKKYYGGVSSSTFNKYMHYQLSKKYKKHSNYTKYKRGAGVLNHVTGKFSSPVNNSIRMRKKNEKYNTRPNQYLKKFKKRYYHYKFKTKLYKKRILRYIRRYRIFRKLFFSQNKYNFFEIFKKKKIKKNKLSRGASLKKMYKDHLKFFFSTFSGLRRLFIVYFKYLPYFFFLKRFLLFIYTSYFLSFTSVSSSSLKIFFFIRRASDISANLLMYLIIGKLLRFYKLSKILYITNQLCNFFLKKERFRGYKILCAGRFSRRDRATYIWSRFATPLNTKFSAIDFCWRNIILKYSICIIKIWVCK